MKTGEIRTFYNNSYHQMGYAKHMEETPSKNDIAIKKKEVKTRKSFNNRGAFRSVEEFDGQNAAVYDRISEYVNDLGDAMIIRHSEDDTARVNAARRQLEKGKVSAEATKQLLQNFSDAMIIRHSEDDTARVNAARRLMDYGGKVHQAKKDRADYLNYLTETGDLKTKSYIQSSMALDAFENAAFLASIGVSVFGKSPKALTTNNKSIYRTGLTFETDVKNIGDKTVVELTSKQKFDRKTGEIITSKYADSNLLATFHKNGNLYINWYSTTVNGKGVGTDMISRAIEVVGQKKVLSISAEMGHTNWDVFNRNLGGGMSPIQAIWQTPLGKSMSSLGYKNVTRDSYRNVTFKK